MPGNDQRNRGGRKLSTGFFSAVSGSTFVANIRAEPE
jgi:hypothetical protein